MRRHKSLIIECEMGSTKVDTKIDTNVAPSSPECNVGLDFDPRLSSLFPLHAMLSPTTGKRFRFERKQAKNYRKNSNTPKKIKLRNLAKIYVS